MCRSRASTASSLSGLKRNFAQRDASGSIILRARVAVTNPTHAHDTPWQQAGALHLLI